jgi:aspartyl-tRNA(Asn)/glutamyl-tRNA(Gln) amidotransferase subunit A
VAFASSLDQVGVFAREVTDMARVLGVIAGRDNHDSTTADTPVPNYLESLSGGLKGCVLVFQPRYLARAWMMKSVNQ